MAFVGPPSTTADGAPQQVEEMTAGGVGVVQLNAAGPGNWFVAPPDAERTYIAFAVPSPYTDIVVIPGSDNGGVGYPLNAQFPVIEFGGRAMRCLVEGPWRFANAAPASLNVITNRGDC